MGAYFTRSAIGRRAARLMTLGVIAAMATGCPTRDDRYDDDIGLGEPLTVEGGLVYPASGRMAYLVVKPGNDGLEIIHSDGAPTRLTRLGDSSRFVALLEGRQILDLVDIADGSRTAYTLGSDFDTLTVSDDGGYALASFSGTGGTGLSNAAEIAVIDLAQPPSDANPMVRTVASKGGVPIGINITPAFGATGRRLALVRSVNHIAALDLADPAGATRSITLAPPGSDTNITPVSVAYRAGATSLDVFVLTTGLDDVIHLSFPDSADSDGAPLPQLNQFAVGVSPQAMAVWEPAGGSRYVITANAGTRDVAIVEVDNARTTILPVDGAISKLMLHDTGAGIEALTWSNGGRTLYRIALDEVAEKKTKAITPLTLVNPIADIVPLADGAWFLVRHPAGAGANVTLIDAEGKRIIPFTGPTANDVVASLDGSRVFLRHGNSSLSMIEVATAHPESIDLSGGLVRQMVRLPGTDALALDYISDFGSVRFVDTREALVLGPQMENFAFDGLLDEEVP